MVANAQIRQCYIKRNKRFIDHKVDIIFIYLPKNRVEYTLVAGILKKTGQYYLK